MNWNPAPSNPLVDGTSPINGVQYQGIHRCSAVQHPTDGHYYLTATGLVANGTAWQLLVFKSPYPLGPYSYYSGPFVPNSYSPEESDILTDYDGSLWGFTSNFARTVASVICQLKGDLTAYTGANNGSLLIREGLAPFRRDRTVWCGHSKETGWWPNNNDAMAMGTPAAQTLASGASAAALWPNTGLFTSAAQQIATPAGAGPSVYPYGYGGELGTDPAGDSAQAYIDGTATGIDPLASYTSQSCKVLRTRTGQRIWIGDRHDYSGVSTGGTLASTYTWWPISFDIDNRPQVPFVSSFAPAAQPALPGASAYYIQSGSPGLAPALIGATR